VAVVAQMQATLDWTRSELERMRALHAERVVSRQLLDKAIRDERQAAANLEAARAQLSVAEGARRQVDATRQNVEALTQHLASQLAVVRQADIARTDHDQGAWRRHRTNIFRGAGPPGSPGRALRPEDRYVRVYIPVTELEHVRVGTGVRIELDAAPGTSFAGRITFIANETQFTPKNIETRDDRVTQVYEAKATILEGVEHFKPGAEGNVYVQLGRHREASVPVAEARPDRARP
jgi:HlyD family secretion protein